MGIQGIYKQIGPGERIALSKIAVEHIEKTGRPFRIAIDISIWQFQIQLGRGGKNPALRTLYYRLLRLLTLSIQPLFIFDGPNKPPFKRGHKIASNAACLPNFLTKELLRHFGFPYHTAPGEAEAECALFQREGIVDAVLSEDVDAIMFGCTMSLRNWTSEAARGSQSPTHVSVYNAETTKSTSGLDSEGMILIALMSGGDYIPAGIPGCGPKTACEAAKAGFGSDLCRLSPSDATGLRHWRKRLEHEIRTNDSKFFRQRHKTITIPESFPNMTVLGYYMKPAVSSPNKVAKLRAEINWDFEVNVTELRLFVAEAFDWQYLTGAKRFIRGLAPALLANRLMHRSNSSAINSQSLEAKELAEAQLVKVICGRRAHRNTDGSPELRLAYIPAEIVGLDLSMEENRNFQGYVNDTASDEQSDSGGKNDTERSRSHTKRKGPTSYDPSEAEKVWILETFVKLGVPLLVETWEEELRHPTKFATQKARGKKKLSKAGRTQGTMDRYIKVSKPNISRGSANAKPVEEKHDNPIPPVFLAPALADALKSSSKKVKSENRSLVGQNIKKGASMAVQSTKTEKPKGNTLSQMPSSSPMMDINLNPWTISKRPPDTISFKSPTRYSALGIYAPDDPENTEKPLLERALTRNTQQAPASPPHSSMPSILHSRPNTPSSNSEDKPTFLQIRHKSTYAHHPSPRDPTQPSPQKNCSWSQVANGLYLAGQLLMPALLSTEQQPQETALVESTEPSTTQKVDRKLKFNESKSASGASSPASNSSSLPSPSTLFSHIAPKMVDDSKTCSESPSRIRTLPATVGMTRKLLAIRESLEGSWKQLELCELAPRSSKSVYSNVEVVDLTAT